MSSVGFNNLAQTALNNFWSSNALNEGAQVLQTPAFQNLETIANQSTFSTGSNAPFLQGGQSNVPGFLSAPAQSPMNMFNQQATSQLDSMSNSWNSLGNIFMQSMQQSLMNAKMQELMGAMQNIANMMNQMSPNMQMSNAINNQVRPGFAQTSTTAASGTASFPGQVGTSFIETLPNSRRGIARALNVSGSRDEKIAQNVVGMLKTSKPKITTGKSSGKSKLNLSAADVEAIQNAPNEKEAMKVVYKAISKQTGVNVGDINMNDKNGIRNDKARNALNKLLGTNIRRGREKNSVSSLTLSSMAESIVKSVRGGSFGSTQVQSPGMSGYGFMGNTGNLAPVGNTLAQTPGAEYPMGEEVIGAEGPETVTNPPWCGTGITGGGFIWHVPGQVQTIPNEPTDISIDLGEFTEPAKETGKLASPLIFDLEGTGLDLRDGGMIAVDIDGDGKKEMITDLDAELGLLIFDSKSDDEDITGRDMFGDNTDLSHYGIKADTQDGNFKDGFQALRAVCEHYKLVNDSKQFLDAGDLAFLEEELGMRMRVGGITSEEDRRFAEVGVTEINLGNPNQTQHNDDAPADRWGNKIMYQDGATFMVYNELRKYADIWFKIQARYSDAESNDDLKINASDLVRFR